MGKGTVVSEKIDRKS